MSDDRRFHGFKWKRFDGFLFSKGLGASEMKLLKMKERLCVVRIAAMSGTMKGSNY